MPPPSSRMTKNRPQPTRYRPGKAEIDDPESEEDESEEEDEDDAPAKAPPPKASSYPAQKKQLAVDLSRAGQQISKKPTQLVKSADDLEGFVTASESSDEDEGSGSEDEDDESSEEEEDSSSDEEPKKPMLAPKFVSKAKREQQASNGPSEAETAAEAVRLRKEKADEMLQAQLERDAAARAAGKKYWDDDDAVGSEPDTTDEVDPEAELAAWKLRELKRVRRDRLAIEEKEKEREEIERRRNMTTAEREEEDRQYIENQKEDQEGKGKMAYMQKYFHKGAFFNAVDGEEQDEEVQRVLNRDLAGARFEDETGDKSVLPEYMRIRDMTRLGRKGRSKYKDLKNEDTGRWGAEMGRGKKREGDGLDEQFRPDDPRDGGRERTGANDMPVGERKKARYE